MSNLYCKGSQEYATTMNIMPINQKTKEYISKVLDSLVSTAKSIRLEGPVREEAQPSRPKPHHRPGHNNNQQVHTLTVKEEYGSPSSELSEETRHKEADIYHVSEQSGWVYDSDDIMYDLSDAPLVANVGRTR